MWGSETHGLLIHDAGQRQNKNIILCYKLSPLSELMHLFFVHFISLFNVQRNELYLFAKAPSPEPNWKTFEENAFLKKKENKQKVIFFFLFACFAAPYVLCHRPTLSIYSLLKEKKNSFHIMHKLLRWLICMNIEHVQVLYRYWFRGWLNIKSNIEEHNR